MLRLFLSILLVTVTICLDNEPEQIHLSLDENLNTVVTWSTFVPTDSVVKFGISENELNSRIKGVQTKFVDPGKRIHTQYIHRTTLVGLVPNTKYYYSCGDGVDKWSKTFNFHVLPTTNDWSPRFGIFGDFGLENAQSLNRITQETQSGHFDLILHVGDFAYDMINENSTTGDKYMRQVEPFAAYAPYMTCPGNHEYHYNFSNYRNRFSMPNRENMFYSYNVGPAHIISFSTEYYYYVWFGIEQVMNQYNWLKDDLEKANKPENRAKRPWIITMAHRPMYCSNKDFDDCTFYNRDLIRNGYPLLHWYGLEKLFFDNGVDLQIYGHEHSFERFWPLMDKKVCNGSYKHPYTNPCAPVHVITGSAGCKEEETPFMKELPPWSAFHSMDYGYSRMTIHNSTHLTFEQVSDDKGGKVIDQFDLIKTKHGPYQPSQQVKSKNTNRLNK